MRRLLILLTALGITWGAAALIPTDSVLRPAAIILSLPGEINAAPGHPLQPSEQEISLLAADTTFEKKLYTTEDPDTTIGQLSGINCGIVLSGHDLNNSIHRPERCLVSQGFQDLQVTRLSIDLGDGRSLEVNRIDSFRTYNAEDGGKSYRVSNINYYWFVGSRSITSSHYGRTLTDMKDRILSGFNQRWAYFSVSSNILENLPGIPTRDKVATDELLRAHIRAVTAHCIKDEAWQ